MAPKAPLRAALSAIGVLVLVGLANAQGILVDRRPDMEIRGSYELREVHVEGTIRKQVAELQISQVYHNPTERTIEAELLFPLPADGAVQDLVLMVNGKEVPGELMSAEEARQVYESIVRRKRDPALLEYAGRGLFKTSVFPIPAGETREVTMRYTQLCRREGHTVGFTYPLGTHKASGRPVKRLTMDLRLKSERPIRSVYSPTHDVALHREGERKATVSLEQRNVRGGGPFRLFYDVNKEPVGTSVLSWRPEKGEDGYFLLLASPGFGRPDREPMPKIVVLVLDKSGSMSGKKIESAREAGRFVLNNLNKRDTFNVIAYDGRVERFRPELQRYTKETRREALGYIDSVRPGGSTNIDEALRQAMGMVRDKNRPSYVLFLTDGKPTAGEQDEQHVAERVAAANRAGARLMAFGVGYDVNARLIDRLSDGNGGESVYVTPDQNLERAVSRFYRRLTAPVLTDVEVELKGAGVNRAHPREPGDLFEGGQLVWAGRYAESGKTTVTIRGRVGDKEHTFIRETCLAEPGENASDSFIGTVWATRRIGHLIDQIDLHGRSEELVDELVELSKRHGILTPYTSFLAREDVELSELRENRDRADDQLDRLQETSGRSAVRQRALKQRYARAQRASESDTTPPASARGGSGRGMMRGSGGTAEVDMLGAPANAEAEQTQKAAEGDGQLDSAVRRVADRTFFFKRGRWVDAQLKEDEIEGATAIERFSEAYFELTRAVPDRLTPCLTWNQPVVLKVDGKLYRIDPPSDLNTEDAKD